MPYRACVFQHGSDYTHVHSKQIALSDTSALQLVNSKNTLPSLRYNGINMGIPLLLIQLGSAAHRNYG